jgi:hypothetical protein
MFSLPRALEPDLKTAYSRLLLLQDGHHIHGGAGCQAERQQFDWTKAIIRTSNAGVCA